MAAAAEAAGFPVLPGGFAPGGPGDFGPGAHLPGTQDAAAREAETAGIS